MPDATTEIQDSIKLADIPDLEIPDWIEADSIVDMDGINSIVQGGCASGAYMPAVTYYNARMTMAEHGDDVLDYIEEQYGELPDIPKESSWSGIAVFFLSCAVEMWAQSVQSEVDES